jgi:hypothetical protein
MRLFRCVLTQPRRRNYPSSMCVKECRAAAAEGVAHFDHVISSYPEQPFSSVASDDSPALICKSSARILPVASLSNLLLSPPPPRSPHLMFHCGAAHAVSAAVPLLQHMSARLMLVARCLQACSAWSLTRNCSFPVALRMSRLCKVALGDLFSACSRPSDGMMELKAVGAEYVRRLRVEAGVAMGNIQACQFFLENRNMCKCIDSFQPCRGSSTLAVSNGQGSRCRGGIWGEGRVMSPLISCRVRQRLEAAAGAASDGENADAGN